MFSGVEKGCIGNEWVNPFLANAAIGNHWPGMGLNVFESNPPVIKFDSLNYYYADHNQPFTSVLQKKKKKTTFKNFLASAGKVLCLSLSLITLQAKFTKFFQDSLS